MSQTDYEMVLTIKNNNLKKTRFFDEQSMFSAKGQAGVITRELNKKDLENYYEMDIVSIQNLRDEICDILSNKKPPKILIDSDYKAIEKFIALTLFETMPIEFIEDDLRDKVIYYRDRLDNRSNTAEQINRNVNHNRIGKYEGEFVKACLLIGSETDFINAIINLKSKVCNELIGVNKLTEETYNKAVQILMRDYPDLLIIDK